MHRSAQQLREWLASPQRHSYREHDYFFRDDDENEWSINGDPVPSRRQNRIFDWIDAELRSRETCPFCSTPLVVDDAEAYFDSELEDEVITSPGQPREIGVFSGLSLCPRCWYWHWWSGGTMGRVCTWDAAVAKIRSFEPTAPPECMQELAVHLRRDPTRWHMLEPSLMEKFVAEIWRHNYAHAEVVHQGRSNDGGVDVLFIDTDGRQCLIQVKRREKPNAGEGVSVLRNLLGAMTLKSAKIGALVSTADHFTHFASEAASRAAALGFAIELYDRGRLDRMLEGFHPAFPWMDFLERNYPRYAEYYATRGFGRI